MEFNGLLAAGIYDWPVISQISWLLGQVMNGIYNVLERHRDPEHRREHHHFHGYRVYASESAHDQAAEIYKDAERNDAGDQKDPEKV